MNLVIDIQQFTESLMWSFSLVLLKRGDDFDIGGNAVIIGKNIAVTATHILRNNTLGSFKEVDQSVLGSEYYFSEESLNILSYSKNLKRFFLLNVQRMISIAGSDISILYLKDQTGLAPDDLWNECIIDVTPPEEDEEVFTIGTRVERVTIKLVDGNLNIPLSYEGSRGLVLSHRLKSHELYASLTANDTFSGSPVFNKNKRLVGLISKSFPDTLPTTCVSLIYPVFINKFLLENVDDYHLYNLAKEKLIRCGDLDRIAFTERGIVFTLPKSMVPIS